MRPTAETMLETTELTGLEPMETGPEELTCVRSSAGTRQQRNLADTVTKIKRLTIFRDFSFAMHFSLYSLIVLEALSEIPYQD